MTVADNMAFALKMAKVSPDERKKRVAEAAKILGLEEFLERKPKALSGGQRQRRHGPRDRAQPAGVLHGRAAVQPGRQDARADRTDIAKLRQTSGSPPSTSPTTRSRP